MKDAVLSLICLGVCLVMSMSALEAAKPNIGLHPDNPRYFAFRGKPAVLITSAEHYGAVLNLDFNCRPYLDELKHCGFNYTRIFTGAYCETFGDFQIKNNTLAPANKKLICPWKRSGQLGYAGGGNKFDLNRWDETYFKRLKSFVSEAGKRGIVVEISLFCPFYSESMWNLSPMNAVNNINGTGNISSQEAYTLKHADITKLQENMTRKIVTELRGFDNVFYEICNEPYFGGITLEWQRHMAAVIKDTESDFPYKHLIAQNIANFTEKVANPDPNVSILNFHYTNPPQAVEDNKLFKGVIGCDETGFQGQNDSPYMEQGWEFIMAGGALYNNLDYSFTIEHPDGSAKVEEPTPGGGSRKLRASLSALMQFIRSFNFIRMSPDKNIKAADDVSIYALSEYGKQYAIYIRNGNKTTVKFDLPDGVYRVKWIDTKNGDILRSEQIKHSGGAVELISPEYKDDVALSLKRK